MKKRGLHNCYFLYNSEYFGSIFFDVSTLLVPLPFELFEVDSGTAGFLNRRTKIIIHLRDQRGIIYRIEHSFEPVVFHHSNFAVCAIHLEKLLEEVEEEDKFQYHIIKR